MPRPRPRDRFLKVDGTTHVMRKDMGLWVSACDREGRSPRSFPWSHAGPATCLDCIATEGSPDDDLLEGMLAGATAGRTLRGFAPTALRPRGKPAWRATFRSSRPFGTLRDALASALLHDGKRRAVSHGEKMHRLVAEAARRVGYVPTIGGRRMGIDVETGRLVEKSRSGSVVPPLGYAG